MILAQASVKEEITTIFLLTINLKSQKSLKLTSALVGLISDGSSKPERKNVQQTNRQQTENKTKQKKPQKSDHVTKHFDEVLTSPSSLARVWGQTICVACEAGRWRTARRRMSTYFSKKLYSALPESIIHKCRIAEWRLLPPHYTFPTERIGRAHLC